MNIAIIIGVSKYSDASNNLPGSKNDADAINKILQLTGKYDRILYINNYETSATIKQLITNFISENKDKEVDELFFYYSGHGEFLNDDFYYILSDFDLKKRNQTSLRNNEMDSLIRRLSPNLVVKVIDACQSGTNYIKEINVLNKYFNESGNVFKRCYFLNSSLNNQSSFQDNEISYFTLFFIKALKEHRSEEIRYKDIIDVISDEFQGNTEQTPFFVTQADYTEKFCTLSEKLKEYLESFDHNNISTAESDKKRLSISDLVKEEAKEYVDKEGAIQVINLIHDQFNAITFNDELTELFNVNVEFLLSYETVPKKGIISNWITSHKNEYFAKQIYVDVWDEDNGPDRILTGFDLKIDSPYKAISIDIISKYPNIFSYRCDVVFLVSKRQIRFFYFIANYIVEGWDELKLNSHDINWVTEEYKISDRSEIINGICKINENIQTRIQGNLEERYKSPNKSDKLNGEIAPILESTHLPK